MIRLKMLLAGLLIGLATMTYGQDDLLLLLGEEETTNLVTASFKANRVINMHSLENTAGGELDIKISHRFGFLSGGTYELFGLDNATIRIGGDYGISDRLMIGAGRSNFEKTYDAFMKFKLLRQSTGKKAMPFTVALLATTAMKTIKFSDPDRENYFSSRLYHTFQMILGRKFSNAFSLQLCPSLVHRNIVATEDEENDVLAIGAGARFKLGKRTSLNAEYIYVPTGQLDDQYRNSLSFGLDIETGGHVFQLHLTNSTSMIEKGFIAETVGDWKLSDVHFGFNVSRTFNVK